MKLYEVEITIRAVVEAESIEDALCAAYDDRRDMMADVDIGCIDINGELLKGQRLPADWSPRYYPYGHSYGNIQKTIEQIWEEQE